MCERPISSCLKNMMKAVVLLTGITLLCPIVRSYYRKPSISFITQPEIVTDIGSDVEMKCSIQYGSDYPIIWMRLDPLDRNNDLVISHSQSIILADPRFSVTFERPSTYTLAIKSIQETDAAMYQCQVLISLIEKEVAEVPLLVRRPPVISDNSTRSVVVVAGQKVQLRCFASGYPEPVIYWRRQGNAVLPTNTSIYKGHVLSFPKVETSHRGTYYCVATNVVGHGSRRNIYVEVGFTPELKIPRKRQGQALQFDGELECIFEAYPAPAITWYKSGRQLTTNQHQKISHYPDNDISTLTRLRVLSIERKQFGNYTCKAENMLGSSEGTVELFETVVPICPPACGTYTPTSGENAVSQHSFLVIMMTLKHL